MSRGQHYAIRDRKPRGWYAIERRCNEAIRVHWASKRAKTRLATALGLYSTLCELANEARGHDVEVGRTAIARQSGVSPSSLSDYFRELQDAGVIHVERRRDGDLNLPNVISLIFPEDLAEVVRQSDPPSDSRPTPLPIVGQGVDQQSEGGSSDGATLIEEGEERKNGKKAAPDKDALPSDFPDELVPHVDAVTRVLRDVAEQKGCNAVYRGAVARSAMARARKPLVKAAHDYAAWCIGGRGQGRQQGDLVAGWRNWLDREADLATFERLPGVVAANGAGGTVPAGGGYGSKGYRDQRAAAMDRLHNQHESERSP